MTQPTLSQPTTVRESSHALPSATLDSLRTRMRGEVVVPGDTDYEHSRRVWNGMIDRRPAIIARCMGAADVRAAVQFAREQELLVAVRGGGHNVAGNAVCDGGLVIDLSRMRGVRVDPRRRTLRAGGGALWGDFDSEAAAHGLATTGGAVSTTGIAGLTLGGGVGWLMRKHGLTCDNLVSADVVTADGQLLVASADEHPDLYWGLRGGGGNFGVVTSFEYQLHLLPGVVGGMVLHPLDRLRDFARFYRDYAGHAPDELAMLFAVLTQASSSEVPASLHGKPLVAVGACYSGPQERAETVLAPLRAFGPPLVDTLRPMPYTTMQTFFDSGSPHGLLNYWKAGFLTGFSDEMVEVIAEHAGKMRSPSQMLEIFQFGGAVNRVGLGETAFGHRHGQFDMTILSKWRDPAASEDEIAWVRAFYEDMRPYTTGEVYVNYLGNEGTDRVRAAYGDNYERLVALKNTYDPTNFFRLNQNIAPTLGARGEQRADG